METDDINEYLHGDDILIIQDGRPQEPTKDPLEINQYDVASNEPETGDFDNIDEESSKNETENVIILDSSDDETSVISKRDHESFSKFNSNQTGKQNLSAKKNSGTILQHSLVKLPLHSDIIDLDVEDSDPLAPLRSFINKKLSNPPNSIIQTTKNVLGNFIYKKNSEATLRNEKNIEVPLINSSKQSPGMSCLDQDTKSASQFGIVQNIKSTRPKNTVNKITKRSIGYKGTTKRKLQGKIITVANSGRKLADESIPNNMSNSLLTRVQTLDKPLDSFINKLDTASSTTQSSEVTNQALYVADVPKPQNLTYLGKIIRIPGQPSLIENSSGLIFRADDALHGLNNVGEENNLESEVNLYKNFLKSSNSTINNVTPAPDLPKPSQDIQVKDICIQKTNNIIKVPESDIQSKTPLIINNSSHTSNVSGKITQLFMSKPPSTKKEMKEQPIIIPYQYQEPNSTILDLKLNINDTRSPSASQMINTLSATPMTLSNDPTGRYNLALGLVLNVNDVNQPNNSCNPASQNKFKSLNNVALDVSFNVSNKEKPATVTSKQVVQKPSDSSLEKLTTPRDVYNESKEKVYCCVACSFQTADLEVMSLHMCPSVNKVLTKKVTYLEPCSSQTVDFETMNSIKSFEVNRKNSAVTRRGRPRTKSKQITTTQKSATGDIEENNSMEKLYSCMSCSFKTAFLIIAESHRCRESNVKYTNVGLPENQDVQNNLNNLDEVLESTSFLCKNCTRGFETKYQLYQHIREVHFGVRRLFSCCAVYFDTVEGLTNHCKEMHSSVPSKLHCKEIYQCSSCHFQTELLKNMKSHFDKHIETYLSKLKTSGKFKRKGVLHESDKTFLHECKLCGKKTDCISIWLTHICQEPEEEFLIREKQRRGYLEEYRAHLEAVTRTYKRRCTEASRGLCTYCKKHIFGEALKCDSSECYNLYHLKCVEVSGRFTDPGKVPSVFEWFCLECNHGSLPVQNDIDDINCCLDLVDNEYFREVGRQNLMANDIKNIKREEAAMKEEFKRIKKFIMDCRSERINNNVVKSVCKIVDLVINARIDSDV